jgi:hypothetical protein
MITRRGIYNLIRKNKFMEFLSIAIPGLVAAMVIGLVLHLEHTRRRRVLENQRRTRLLIEAIRNGI